MPICAACTEAGEAPVGVGGMAREEAGEASPVEEAAALMPLGATPIGDAGWLRGDRG